jgi:uncharacterized protein (TIGR00299 family) protein
VKIAYFDLSGGVSGDMILGALVDAGVPLSLLRKELKKLPVTGYKLTSGTVKRKNLEARKVDVVISGTEKSAHRKFADVKRIIDRSTLLKPLKEKCLSIFGNLARAEAFAHGTTPGRVTFHEVGAVDAIVDVAGAVIALDALEVKRVYASAFSTGSGFVSTAHGRMPVPSPATAKLLEGHPVRCNVRRGEMTTPTGAAVITTLAAEIGAKPSFRLLKTGRGAGTHQSKELPNILRVLIGETADASESDEVFVIETNIDDMTGEVFGVLFDRLLEAGALDVCAVPVMMKKSRPAYLLSVIADETKKTALEKMILKETSTFGVRSWRVSRKKLHRSHKSVRTRLGKVRLKVGVMDGRAVKAIPEYEDCRKLSKKHGVPFIDVYTMAVRAAGALRETDAKRAK